MDLLRRLIRIAFSVVFFSAGIYHFAEPEFFTAMMPPYIPMQTEVVFATGVIEIIGAVCLQFEGVRRWAGWAMLVYLLALLPVHIHMYQESVFIPGFLETKEHLAGRIGLQFVLVVLLWFSAASADAE